MSMGPMVFSARAQKSGSDWLPVDFHPELRRLGG
jgi:hypothetical protein